MLCGMMLIYFNFGIKQDMTNLFGQLECLLDLLRMV